MKREAILLYIPTKPMKKRRRMKRKKLTFNSNSLKYQKYVSRAKLDHWAIEDCVKYDASKENGLVPYVPPMRRVSGEKANKPIFTHTECIKNIMAITNSNNVTANTQIIKQYKHTNIVINTWEHK